MSALRLYTDGSCHPPGAVVGGPGSSATITS
jgi:hypothetical protein